jgi:hypothetical protein
VSRRKRENRQLRWLQPIWDRKRRETARRVEGAVQRLVSTGKAVTLEAIRQVVKSEFKVSISTNTILRNEEAYAIYLQHSGARRRAKPRSPLLMGLLGNTVAAKRVALRSKLNRLRRESKDALIFRVMQLEESLNKQTQREDNLREEVLRLSLQSRTKGKTK